MSIEDNIKEDAINSYPSECVGYVSKGTYHTLNNISNTPDTNYKLSLVDRFLLDKINNDGLLEALVHSHPILDNSPSEVDMEAHIATGYNFYIIGTDGKTTTDIRRINYEKSNS